MLIVKLKEMFHEMVLRKDTSLIPYYYHPDFILYTNDQKTDYQAFLESHEKYYATPIKYEIEYDNETFLEQGDKIAGRVWITTTRPTETAKKIEVILIYRLWELTYPDWSKLPAFK
jgi:hypothetical protein